MAEDEGVPEFTRSNMAPRSNLSGRCDRRKNCGGFTLLEIAIVLVIVGIVTTIALPAFERMQRNSRFSTLINDLRVLAGAFQHYNSTNGEWPALSASVGVVPAGMQDFLRDTNWTKQTAFGGGFIWEQDVTHNGRKVRAAIAIQPTDTSPVRITPKEMAQFDTMYDDGNLTTGYFQAGYLDLPLYVLEDDPAYVATTDASAVDQAVADAAAQAAADAAAAQAAAAEKAKADAIKALQATQSAAISDLKLDQQRYDDLVKLADRLDVNVPKNLRNRLENLKDAVDDLKSATVDSGKLAKYIEDYQEAQAALVKALNQYETTLQAAQAKADKKKGK